jgi:hypothetical protein
MFLTYASIVSTYVPAIFEGLSEAAASAEAEAAEESGAIVEANAEIEPSATLAAGREAEAGELASGSEDHGGPLVGGALGALLGLGLFALFVLAAPIIAGFENFMGWIILAIGLYEAWKLNRRETLIFEGPFRLAGTRPEYRPEPPPAPITPA